MAILRNRDDDGDSTIYLTLTSTSTMSSRSAQETNNGESVVQVVTWVPQTSVATMVTSALVTQTSTGAAATPTASSTTIATTGSTSSSPGATIVYVSPSSSTTSSETTSPTTTQDTTQSSSISTTTSSARRISSTSDVPTLSTLNDIPATSSTNRSTEIGVAIGIPIAIFSIFFIVLGIWYFIRSRKNKKNKTKQLSFNENYYKSRSSDETITTDKPYPVVFSPGAYLKQEQEGRSMKGYEVEQGKESSFAKRFSRMFPVRNKDLEGGVEGVSEGTQSNFMKRMSVMTPIFLKKFNLGKVDEVDEVPVKVDKDTIKPQVLRIDDEGRKVPKVKNKLNLPPTITIGESGLDPVRGGVSPEQSLYTVIRSYSKNLGDELDIEVGDKVVILEKHSDGWCKVRKIRMGKEYYVHQSSQDTGLVPRMCLQKI
ncbi:hypothetical protein Cantr_09803 [Candida viswanathii]|uniref:SH3 domain-containing protein n=1 Tax=Candida viswanathii TaxID=5486 RepID=A0A367YDV4_9ASCO|nr:hypothetical protein Cantr_09803 [Candida viswanathii]